MLSSPNPLASDSEFFGVSCRRLTLYVATGISRTSQGIVTLSEVWQGGKWRIVPTVSP
jgi:hypothetical protein